MTNLNHANRDAVAAPGDSVLVLGGGFTGLEIAMDLAKSGLSVTLVSDRPEMFVYPTSIWMVTGEHRRADDVLNLAAAAASFGFTFVQGAVEQILPESKSAVVDGRTLRADYLVLAAGAGRFPVPGTEHTHTVWGAPEDTEALHEALEALIAKGEGRIAMGFGGNPADGSAVRGGPLFEVLFNVDLMLRRRGVRDRFALSFFAPMPNPGVRMGEKAAASVGKMLSKKGIAQHTGKKIARFDDNGVVFADGARLDADLTVFIPGGDGHPLVRNTALPLNDAGFVTIDGQCRVPGFDGVYAVGDIAAVEGPSWRAKQGHLSVIMAKIAASAVAAETRGKTVKDDYRKHVSIVCVMDMGNAAAFVKRTEKAAKLLFLPIVGHLLKKAWGFWYRFTHRKLLRAPSARGLLPESR